jgi:hypothetical protein
MDREVRVLSLSVPDRSSRRFPHYCGDGRPLQISRDGPTVRAYCHRCSLSEGWRLEESFQDRLARLQAQASGDAELGRGFPEPRVLDMGLWPVDARVWLFKAGVTQREAEGMGWYYHERSDRVVLPFPEQDFWIARAYQKGRVPKYLAVTPKPHGLLVKFGAGKTIVLCEDVLSAYKVGKVTEGWALLGTKLSQDHCARLIADGRPVVTWLDPDDPGQVGATKIRAQLRAFGVPVRNVVSLRDPKLHSAAEIKGYLYG